MGQGRHGTNRANCGDPSRQTVQFSYGGGLELNGRGPSADHLIGVGRGALSNAVPSLRRCTDLFVWTCNKDTKHVPM